MEIRRLHWCRAEGDLYFDLPEPITLTDGDQLHIDVNQTPPVLVVNGVPHYTVPAMVIPAEAGQTTARLKKEV